MQRNDWSGKGRHIPARRHPAYRILHTRDLLDPVSTAYENVLSFQELSGKLTQKQRQIAALRSQGYRDLEIARMFRVKPGEIKLEMDQARSKVVPFPTETAALAA